jgi:uncharacterized protein YndB with AHSA1/START domain
MDFKEGGEWLYAMVGPEGEEHWAMAKFISIDPQKSFKAYDTFTDSEGNINSEMPEATWDVSFSEKGNNTLVEFNISYPNKEQLEANLEMGFKEGMTSAMEGLDDWLASR